jgi:hypothetical protein
MSTFKSPPLPADVHPPPRFTAPDPRRFSQSLFWQVGTQLQKSIPNAIMSEPFFSSRKKRHSDPTGYPACCRYWYRSTVSRTANHHLRKEDVRISLIRLSDWLYREAHDARGQGSRRNLTAQIGTVKPPPCVDRWPCRARLEAGPALSPFSLRLAQPHTRSSAAVRKRRSDLRR